MQKVRPGGVVTPTVKAPSAPTAKMPPAPAG